MTFDKIKPLLHLQGLRALVSWFRPRVLIENTCIILATSTIIMVWISINSVVRYFRYLECFLHRLFLCLLPLVC